MKRWIALGILALLLIISMSTCSSNSTEVDRLKNEVAELSKIRAELNELQSSYDTLLSEYNKLQAATISSPEETETPSTETRIEKLPYSWTEGVMFYTIKVTEGEDYWGADEWDFYEVRLGYENTSRETTKWNLRVGGFKLKTDVGNVYGLESGGLHGSELAPQDEGEFVATVFKIHQGEVPVELWWYQVAEGKTSIIFELET